MQRTYNAQQFPEAKYILTLRNSAEEWYNSLVAFHEKVFGSPLDSSLLKNVNYRYSGFAWEANRVLYSSPENDPYKKENLIADYEAHRAQVVKDFAGSKNLLVLKIQDPEAPQKLSEFLELKMAIAKMPWLNKTEKI
ncbi:MAG: sulfotransferase [Bacteroidota bacterium]